MVSGLVSESGMELEVCGMGWLCCDPDCQLPRICLKGMAGCGPCCLKHQKQREAQLGSVRDSMDVAPTLGHHLFSPLARCCWAGTVRAGVCMNSISNAS